MDFWWIIVTMGSTWLQILLWFTLERKFGDLGFFLFLGLPLINRKKSFWLCVLNRAYAFILAFNFGEIFLDLEVACDLSYLKHYPMACQCLWYLSTWALMVCGLLMCLCHKLAWFVIYWVGVTYRWSWNLFRQVGVKYWKTFGSYSQPAALLCVLWQRLWFSMLCSLCKYIRPCLEFIWFAPRERGRV